MRCYGHKGFGLDAPRKSFITRIMVHSMCRSSFAQACAAANVKVSMGSVGDCYDNAMAESLIATLNTELIGRQPRQCFRTLAEANQEVFSYLEGFYNPRRSNLFSAGLSVSSSI